MPVEITIPGREHRTGDGAEDIPGEKAGAGHQSSYSDPKNTTFS